MRRKIFGPVLVVKTYRDIGECIAYVNARARPLALYWFGRDEAERERVLRETISGGVSVNNVMMHFACDDLPFGGVGGSGMGHYHGRDGFRTLQPRQGSLPRRQAEPVEARRHAAAVRAEAREDAGRPDQEVAARNSRARRRKIAGFSACSQCPAPAITLSRARGNSARVASFADGRT